MSAPEPVAIDPIPVEIVRTKTDADIGTGWLLMTILTEPMRALVVWWLLHYLPVPDLNYWQCLALVVIVRVLGSTFSGTRMWWTRERGKESQ